MGYCRTVRRIIIPIILDINDFSNYIFYPSPNCKTNKQMKNWTEFQIGVIYFLGLLVALLSTILCIWYLRPINKPIKKITREFGALWNGSFKTTVIISGLLGAILVSFKDCEGNYDYLLESKSKTVLKGLEQVSTSFDYLTITMGIWLVIFIALFLILNKKNKTPST